MTARNGAQLFEAQISFQIETGAAMGLTGQSGAGKTTLLSKAPARHFLAAAVRSAAGMIQVDGQSLWALSPREAPRSTVRNDPGLYPTKFNDCL